MNEKLAARFIGWAINLLLVELITAGYGLLLTYPPIDERRFKIVVWLMYGEAAGIAMLAAIVAIYFWRTR